MKCSKFLFFVILSFLCQLQISAQKKATVSVQQKRQPASKAQTRKPATQAAVKVLTAEEIAALLQKHVDEPYEFFSPFDNRSIKARLTKWLGQKKISLISNHYGTIINDLTFEDGLYFAYGGTPHAVCWGTAWGYDPKLNVFYICTNVLGDDPLYLSEDGSPVPASLKEMADQMFN